MTLNCNLERERTITKRNLIHIGLLLCAAVLPAVTSGAQPVTKVAGGEDHSLSLKSDGSLWATGYNYFGHCVLTMWAKLERITRWTVPTR